jgi:hypothetical protein
MKTRPVVALVVLAVLLFSAAAAAQFGRRGQRFRQPRAVLATPADFEGAWHYCRAVYTQNPRGDGGGWSTDYPSADVNLSIRFSELTKTPVGFDDSGYPKHLIVRLTDPELFRCPFIMMQEVGALYFSDEDAAALRQYLLKGGFLWVDDFWGSYAWAVWENEIQKVFPPSEFPILDVPSTHPIMRTLFDVEAVPQIPSINQYWSGGTSERGADSAVVHTRAIADANGRIMVMMTHNTDVSDSWEREGEDPRYFYEFSVNGYAVGINILLYSMTH